MKVEIHGGEIVVGTGKLTPKEATDLIKRIKDAVREVKKTHCTRGHARTKDNWYWSELANGYVVKLCKDCRATWQNKYYSDEVVAKRVRANALARYHQAKERSHARPDAE